MSAATPPLTDAEVEELQLFLAGLQALAGEPVAVLVDAGVVDDAVTGRSFRDDPLTRFLDFDGDRLAAFWRLARRIHADRRSGARAD